MVMVFLKCWKIIWGRSNRGFSSCNEAPQHIFDDFSELLKVDKLTELKLKIEAYKEHLGLECNVIDGK